MLLQVEMLLQHVSFFLDERKGKMSLWWFTAKFVQRSLSTSSQLSVLCVFIAYKDYQYSPSKHMYVCMLFTSILVWKINFRATISNDVGIIVLVVSILLSGIRSVPLANDKNYNAMIHFSLPYFWLIFVHIEMLFL